MPMPTNLLTIIISRIIILAAFSVMLFVQWYKSKNKKYSDFKFLFFLQFSAQALGKIYDIYLYDLIGDISVIKSNPLFLWLVKMRWMLILGIIIPVFSMMIFLYFSRDRKKQKILNYSFILISLVLVLLAPTYGFLQVFLPIMILPLMILVIITFWNLHRHKRLPEFNSLLMTVSYVLYLFMQIARPIMVTIGEQYMWIIEGIEGIAW
ncbi:MAG: hypothetical protein ACTSWY_00965, partial [Promethearchaeota archaeon]